MGFVHFSVGGGHGTITKKWHIGEAKYPWWIVPARVTNSHIKTIKLGVRRDGTVGDPNSARDYIVVDRDDDNVTIGPDGGGWTAEIDGQVAAALDRIAGSKLMRLTP